MLRGKRVLSVYDLSEPTWAGTVDRGTVEEFETADWGDSDDPDRLQDFLELLSRCLGGRTRQLGLKYNQDHEYYFFPPTPDLRALMVNYQSMRRGSERTVFQHYATKKSGEAVREFYRHSAFSGQFRRYDGEWFLEITPTYRFTEDGYRPLRYYESKLKGIKALEKNPTVLGQVVMWADLLRGRTDDLFASPPYPHLEFDELRTFTLDAGINEAAWLATESDEGTKAIATASIDDLPLFGDSPYAG